MPFKFLPNAWSHEARAESKLRRNISRTRLLVPGFKARGMNTDSDSLMTSPISPIATRSEEDLELSNKAATLSVTSTGSGVSGARDSFREGVSSFSDHAKSSYLKRDYKQLYKQLDELDYDGWAKLTGTLDKMTVIGRLIETSKSPHSHDIRRLSHQIIFRFVMCGFIVLSEVTSTAQELGDFIKEHADFLAEHFPAALLLSLMKHKKQLAKFEDCIENTWSGSGLLEAVHNSLKIIRKYTIRFGQVPESIRDHAAFLTEGLLAKNLDLSDISLLTGYFPWLYFHVDPVDDDKEWSKRTLTYDGEFLKLIDGVYATPLARFKAVQHLSDYYTHEKAERSTVLHLMIYLCALQQLGVDPQKPPDGVREALPSISDDLNKHFTPGNYRLQTYYICSHGETLVWAMGTLTDEKELSKLIRFIITNMANWPQVKENSSLQCGMVRTLYMALKACGVDNFTRDVQANKGNDISSVVWHLGNYFRTTPNSDFAKDSSSGSDDKSKKSAEIERSPAQTPAVVNDDILKEITSVIQSPGLNFDEQQLSIDETSTIERWKLKIRLSAAILNSLIAEGNGDADKEVFRALEAIGPTNPSITVQGEDDATEKSPELLSVLIKELKTGKGHQEEVKGVADVREGNRDLEEG